MFLVFLTAAAAQPAPPPTPPGRVIFVRGDALLQVDGEGKGAEIEIAKLPLDVGVITAIETSPDAGLIVVRGNKGSAWLVAGETTWRTGCVGLARPSPANECLLCEVNGALVLMSAKQSWNVKVPGVWRDANFLGSVREIAALVDEKTGVLGFATKAPKQTRVLAAPGPSGHLLIAPDGSKAVAVFGHGKSSRVHGFVLDGQGVPRNLGGPALPVVWSWDSSWVLIEYGVPTEAGPDDDGSDEGEDGGGEDEGGGESGAWQGGTSGATWLLAAGAPAETMVAKGKSSKKDSKKKKKVEREEPPARIRSCVVRAIGGEAKCWNHFAARGFGPGHDRVLLYKDGALWVGKIPGVRAETPRRIIEKADGPAAWVP